MAESSRVVEGEWGEAQYFQAPDGTLLAAVPRDGVVEVHCHGPNDHFRDPDGGCCHTDDFLAAQSGRYTPVVIKGYRAYESRAAMEADRA